MNETLISLVQPLAYRVWDTKYQSFFYTDAQPDSSALVERWTGLFDKQGAPIYEHDIIRAHYNWEYGWVRALVLRDVRRGQFWARATTIDGAILHVGFYSFADAYRLGNLREHPGRLTAATEQFPEHQVEPWWLSTAIFQGTSRSSYN